MVGMCEGGGSHTCTYMYNSEMWLCEGVEVMVY